MHIFLRSNPSVGFCIIKNNQIACFHAVLSSIDKVSAFAFFHQRNLAIPVPVKRVFIIFLNLCHIRIYCKFKSFFKYQCIFCQMHFVLLSNILFLFYTIPRNFLPHFFDFFALSSVFSFCKLKTSTIFYRFFIDFVH